jgi:putative glycosyltransferase (TIGR04348 family)
LGHDLTIDQNYNGVPGDLLIALHARRSADAIFRFRQCHPEKPIIVALTGTDVYRDIRRSRKAQRVLEIATRLVVLQPLALRELPAHLIHKGRVIYQSARKTRAPVSRNERTFDVCVVGHLRKVKDPFRAAYASRKLPASSQTRVLHIGLAREAKMAQKARLQQIRNPRYQWLGGMPHWRVRRRIAASRLMVLSSRMEGGANVISEALVDKVPVLASRIAGSVGLLGEDYAGYFPVGDSEALTRLLLRAEQDRSFYAELKSWCSRLSRLFQPSREQAAWRNLLREVVR